MLAQKKEIREEKTRDELSHHFLVFYAYVFFFNLFFLGKNEHFLVQEDKLSSITGQALCQQLPDKRTCPPETTKESSVLKPVLGQTLDPSSKIKLQLFPIDEGTRIGLERVKL